jgi:uncharacterized protein
MSDPVVQWQIVARNPEAVGKFYRELFGWKITANNALGYREVETGEGGTRGGIWPSPPDGHDFVQLFMSVEDVARSVAKATELGARVIVPPTALPDGDILAILADPSGIAFGVMQRR